MLPLSVLQTAKNQPMLVELKNGDTYNGHLVNCDNFMNINLRDVIKTSRDGDEFFSLKSCYIRGNQIKYLRIPEDVIDMVPDEPVYQARGRGRGRGGSNNRGGRGRGGRNNNNRGGYQGNKNNNNRRQGGGNNNRGGGRGGYNNNKGGGNRGGRGGYNNNKGGNRGGPSDRNNQPRNNKNNNNNNQQRQTPSQQPKALGQPLRNQGDKQVQQGGAEKKAPSRALQMARARAEAKKKLAASKKASE